MYGWSPESMQPKKDEKPIDYISIVFCKACACSYVNACPTHEIKAEAKETAK